MVNELIGASSMLHGDGWLGPGWVQLADDRIVAAGRTAPPRNPDRVLDSGVLAPGFIDLQFNGAGGLDFADARRSVWDQLLREVLTTGVTSVVPTLVTAPLPDLLACLRFASTFPQQVTSGQARALGVHLEGPFLAPVWRGAHNEPDLLGPTSVAVDELLQVGAGALRMVTLAPELPGGFESIARLTEAGVVVAIGHTGASDEQARHAIDLGARLVTHLYNAQTGLHHREPGVVGQVLTDSRVVASLIVDLIHVAAPAVRLAFASKPGKIALITDSVPAAGLPVGRHQMADGEVVVSPDGVPRRLDGTLAGSALTMDQAIRNAVAIGIRLADALAAATHVPADVLGRADVGRIAPGAHADLVWLDDELIPGALWLGGRATDINALLRTF